METEHEHARSFEKLENVVFLRFVWIMTVLAGTQRNIMFVTVVFLETLVSFILSVIQLNKSSQKI